MLPAFLATVLFSVSVLSAGRTTRALGGAAANFYRLCLATVMLAVWAHAWGKGVAGGAFGFFFLSGCVGFGLGDLALYQALPRVGPRLSALMVHCLAAPMAALAEWLWLGTHLTSAEVISGLIILAGVAVAIAPGEHLHLSPKRLAEGVTFGVAAAVGQGLGAVITRKAYAVVLAGGQTMDGGTAAYQRILGGLLVSALPTLWMMTRKRNGTADRSAAAGQVDAGRPPGKAVWFWVALNSLTGPTLGVGCYQWALEHNPSGVVLPIVATTPIVVVPFAWWLEGDRPGPRSLLGGLLAVAGAVALTMAR